MRPSLCLTGALVAPLAMLAGCAAPGPYPSLAPRPAERLLADSDVEQAPAPLPDDPALAERIVRLTAEAREGEVEFDAAFTIASVAAGRAGAPESESWIEAQQALSRAEAARSRIVAALADLDAYSLERAEGRALSEADKERAIAAVARVQAIADAEHDRLARLQVSLGPV